MAPNSIDGSEVNKRYDALLASFAVHNGAARGRKIREKIDPNRTPFQRDRDRIIHSKAFRRLPGKTQVLSPSQSAGDHYRNRLTHSLEVAQIARDIARELRLNEDLCETIALAHDLGHPPFGHLGEQALDEKMKVLGSSFDHNKQSQRVVEVFEKRYEEFFGLNLSFEVIEGLQKHETVIERSDGLVAVSPSLEAQVVDMADEMAYLAADLEDALRGGFITPKQMRENSFLSRVINDFSGDTTDADFLSQSITRRVLHYLINDIIPESLAAIKAQKISHTDQAQSHPDRLIRFSATQKKEFFAVKNFLFTHFYNADSVKNYFSTAREKLEAVFDYLYKHPDEIPAEFLKSEHHARRVCDYIAGTTDRFLLSLWGRQVGKL